MTDNIKNEDLLAKLRELIGHIENGDDERAKVLLDEMTNSQESYLFMELGKLTRRLHDALANFQLDTKLAGLANNDIPDAKERLKYVITMTEQSANRTLGAIEQSVPIVEDIQSQITQAKQEWGRFINKQMPVSEFRSLSKKITQLFGHLEEQNPIIKDNLSEVLMAQEFQDLTSQVIRKVINLVEELEDNLVTLIKMSGGVEGMGDKDSENKDKLAGPNVPGTSTNATSVASQDEVDDLLSSLGF